MFAGSGVLWKVLSPMVRWMAFEAKLSLTSMLTARASAARGFSRLPAPLRERLAAMTSDQRFLQLPRQASRKRLTTILPYFSLLPWLLLGRAKRHLSRKVRAFHPLSHLLLSTRLDDTISWKMARLRRATPWTAALGTTLMVGVHERRLL